jgi:hypothetical protein
MTARPSYSERMAAVTGRLRELLAAETEQESRIVDWLVGWDLPTLEPLAVMIERAVREGHRDGWTEGLTTAADAVQRTLRDAGAAEVVCTLGGDS